ncbi:MAG TPA: outer membrane protein assembly factor BamD [Opitutales bacterium]|nr:outer membrane protein assembly factor BamD [Opitutales bacterium]
MINLSLQSRLLQSALLLLFFAGAFTLHGQLAWDPEIGWHIEDQPDSQLPRTRGLILMTMAREAQDEGHQGLALRLYRSVQREAGNSIFAPEAHFQSSTIRMERKQWTKAFDNLQAIVDQYPNYPKFRKVIRRQFEIADGLRQGKRLRLFWKIPGFKSPERAIDYFKQIVENAPYSEEAPIALLKAAQLQSGTPTKLDETIDLYDRFINDYPDHERVSDAYFGLADAFSTQMQGPAYDQGANREAISYFEDFIILYPDHPRAGQAEERVLEMSQVLAENRILLGDFYSRYRKNYTAARIFYNEAITIAPLAETAEKAREKLARIDQIDARK